MEHEVSRFVCKDMNGTVEVEVGGGEVRWQGGGGVVVS